MDINNTANLRALLDQLRDSPAWQQTIAPTASAGPADVTHTSGDPQTVLPSATPLPDVDDYAVNPTDGPVPSPASVASLLSQLQRSAAVSPSQDIRHVSASHEPARTAEPQASQGRVRGAPAVSRQDLRTCTYAQALSTIGQLSEDENFVDFISKLKDEQSRLEKRLWDEREAIQKKHRDKVQLARTRANMIGGGMTKFEADSMTQAFRRELELFDLERVLPAWDGLVSKQQTTLEALGVPTMFPSAIAEDRKRQQQVAAVLSGVTTQGEK